MFAYVVSCRPTKVGDLKENLNGTSLTWRSKEFAASKLTGNELFDSSEYTICYSNSFNGTIERDLLKENGYIGQFNNRSLYYELYSIPNGNYLNIDFLFLRTDTTSLKGYDFCFPEPASNARSNTMILKKYNTISGDMIIDTSLTFDKIPGFVQPLIVAMNGWQSLSGLNQPDTDNPKIYLRNENLYIRYWDMDNIGNGWLVRLKYKFDGKIFILAQSKIIKRIHGEKY
jgi:hypothetical protein